MTHPFNRRDFLTGVAGPRSPTRSTRLRKRTGPRTNITVRIDRDLAVLDPAGRTGPWDGNVIRCVQQRLMKQKPNSSELELDAAAEVKQVSPTVIEFRLKPGQMFTDGFGEMTADDVKFSFERIGLPAKDAVATYKNDWLYLTAVEVKSKYEGRIVLSQPRANLFDVVIGDVSGCIVSKKAVEQRGADIATKPWAPDPIRWRRWSARKAPSAPQRRVRRAQAALRGNRDPFHLRRAHDRSRAALRRARLRGASPSAAEPLRSVSGITLNEQPSIATSGSA
jgi:peptide/nickel transport system substrate-binding protein